MQPVVVIDPEAPPDDTLAWAQYGAMQALTMLGISFRVATGQELRGAEEIPLLVMPAQGMTTRVWAAHLRDPERLGPTSDFLTVGGTVPVGGAVGSLPLFGPGDQVGAPYLLERRDDSLACRLAPGLFATLGLYLSRFSWEGRPVKGGSFVQQIDALWDEHLAPRWGQVPVVDECLLLVEQAFIVLYEDLRIPYVRKWPQPIRGGRICTHGLILTHDVDATYEADQFRDPAAATASHLTDPDALQPLAQAQNRWFNFRQWADLETQLRVKSAFFLMSPDPALEYWCSPGYNLADAPVAAAAWRLARLGWEVSIHQLGVDRQELLDGERRWFERTMRTLPTGTRSHYLKHAPHTLALKAASGHAYDSTWYAETTQSSFLCGTTRPFGPFGLAAPGQPTRLWEFPFVAEDGIVFGVYGDAPRDTAGAIAEGGKVLAQALRHNGFVCLNAHQRTFARMGTYQGTPDDWTPAYEGLIRELQTSSPALWTPLPRELAAWWSARERVALDSRPKGLVVTNKGAAPIGDLVIVRPAGAAGGLWTDLVDGVGRRWFARATGLLRPGETRVYPW